jgi:amidophosphoribosyltransferase
MCGLFAIVGHPQAAQIALSGLQALQHRGEASTGLVAGRGATWHAERRAGRVDQAWQAWRDNGALLGWQAADWALGHVRYPTSGQSGADDAQPLTAGEADGLLAVAHNGQLTNAAALWRQLGHGSDGDMPADTTAILRLLQQHATGDLAMRLAAVLPQLQGAYSLAVQSTTTLLLARDPHGFRPLVLGQLAHAGGMAWLAASEAVALQACGATVVREVAAGEMVSLDATGITSHGVVVAPQPRRACVFEPVYFAHAAGQVFGCDVAAMRRASGARLAVECAAHGADAVVAIPESGTLAAAAYAAQAGLPLIEGLQRAPHAGRSFLLPSMPLRQQAVRTKLTAIREAVAGRALVVVDDSLVRGTTARAVLAMLRDHGARQLHLRIASPPVRWPCWYGIDTPERSELAAAMRDETALCAWLGADSIGYLSLSGLIAASGGEGWCTACFDGAHPLPLQS